MKKIKYLILILIASQLTIFTSCDTGFEETNTNTNDPTEVPAELLLAGILRSAANSNSNIF